MTKNNLTEYLISGDFEQIGALMELPVKSMRFMSDSPNIESFRWYPITEDTQAVEMLLNKPLSTEEIEFLTEEYRSLTIAKLEKGEVTVVTSEGKSVVLSD